MIMLYQSETFLMHIYTTVLTMMNLVFSHNWV